MQDNDMNLERLLNGLPQAHSDDVRAERVRARCQRVLQDLRTPGPQDLRTAGLESALVGTFSVIYLCAVALFALKSQGVL
jgi:hypothetical protein